MVGPKSAQGRPARSRAGRDGLLQVDTLGERQGVLDVDAEVTHRAVHLRVAEQQLDRTQVSGLLVDLRHLGPPHRMRAVGARLQADRHDPPPDDPGILSRRQVRAAVDSAGPQELQADHFGIAHPALEGQPRRLGDLEPDRLPRLALDHRGAFLDPPGGEDIPDPEADEIATAQLAVHGHVEQRQVARIARHLEADANGPDMPGQKRAFLADDAALVPRHADRTEDGKKIDGHGTTSCPPGPPFFGHADHYRIPRFGPGVGASGGKPPVKLRHRIHGNLQHGLSHRAGGRESCR